MKSTVILHLGGYLVKEVNLLNVNIKNIPKIKAKRCVSGRSIGRVSHEVSHSLGLVISSRNG